MLRSQMAVAAALNLSHGLTVPRTYPISKTTRSLTSPVGREVEIDVEYGTDDNADPVKYKPREVVVEQMSSEWWVEGSQMEHCRLPHSRGMQVDPLVNIIVPACSFPLWTYWNL